ncbi:MAG: ABC transporter ATP-binding protein [Tissierellia bacterium]|nr:ABC transporter ATP-binding protein [Tissierellia bacterium]
MGLLNAENLTIEFGGVRAVADLNLDIKEGEITSIIGPNGAGKTTTFNIITGVYKPTVGNIIFDGENITGMRPDLITKLGIARTFQNIRLFKELSVFENVIVAKHTNLASNFLTSTLRLPKYKSEENNMEKETIELLERVDLLQHRDDKANSLPYGKQRRLEIARALATKPRLLLLDEPAAGMNPNEMDEMTSFILKIKEDFDLTILIIEHHMDLVMEVSDNIHVMDFGIKIAEGTPEEVQNNEKVIAAYLGVDEDA